MNSDEIASIEDNKSQTGAVLLSNEIERYVREFDLITPFNINNLKAASYQLTIGENYAIGGIIKKLDGKGDYIDFQPFNVVIIQTNEIIKMPLDLIARWNIRVTLAYRGLVWVGGPQVDPGYHGHLYCPIYNLSNEVVRLPLGESIATIDFTKTTPFIEGTCKKFEIKRKDDIRDYNHKWESGLLTEIQKIDKITVDLNKSLKAAEIKNEEKFQKNEESTQKSIREIRSRLDAFIFAVITIIGVILTVISVLITFSKENDFSIPLYVTISLIVSMIALFGFIYIISEKDLLLSKIQEYELQCLQAAEKCEKEKREKDPDL